MIFGHDQFHEAQVWTRSIHNDRTGARPVLLVMKGGHQLLLDTVEELQGRVLRATADGDRLVIDAGEIAAVSFMSPEEEDEELQRRSMELSERIADHNARWSSALSALVEAAKASKDKAVASACENFSRVDGEMENLITEAPADGAA